MRGGGWFESRLKRKTRAACELCQHSRCQTVAEAYLRWRNPLGFCSALEAFGRKSATNYPVPLVRCLEVDKRKLWEGKTLDFGARFRSGSQHDFRHHSRMRNSAFLREINRRAPDGVRERRLLRACAAAPLGREGKRRCFPLVTVSLAW